LCVRLRSQNREFAAPRGEKHIADGTKTRDDGNSSAVVSGSVPTRRVRFSPRPTRTPVCLGRPPNTLSTSDPVGGVRRRLRTPVFLPRARIDDFASSAAPRAPALPEQLRELATLTYVHGKRSWRGERWGGSKKEVTATQIGFYFITSIFIPSPPPLSFPHPYPFLFNRVVKNSRAGGGDNTSMQRHDNIILGGGMVQLAGVCRRQFVTTRARRIKKFRPRNGQATTAMVRILSWGMNGRGGVVIQTYRPIPRRRRPSSSWRRGAPMMASTLSTEGMMGRRRR